MKSLAASFPDVKNPDLWFPAVSMIVIATAASLLLLDFYKEYDYQRDKKEKIGKIIYKSKTSQRRQNARVIWSNVEKETPIYNFDTIRTEDLSEAVIELNDGTRIALEENTMVVVSFSRKETNINFTKGTVRALQKYNDSEINIKAGNKEIKATEVGNLVLSSKNGRDFTAVSKKGKLTITDDAGLPKSISNEEELRFSNQSTEVEKLSLNLISPEDNVRYYTAGSPVKVTLKYKNDENHPLLLQLSDHYSFSKVIKELKTRSGNTSVSLTEGNYYWRILNKETDKKSEIRSVKIIKNKPVTLYTP
ncbi:MAG: FecR family protein, partial [Spirochaetia bacterium]|nr:FecR family protein [Spirochaetia bacterium]